MLAVLMILPYPCFSMYWPSACTAEATQAEEFAEADMLAEVCA